MAPLRSLSPFRLGLGLGRVRSKVADRSVRPTQDDLGVEQGAGDGGGDRDQVALAVEDFDLAGAGEFGEIDGCNGLKVVGTQATEPNTLMQCCHQPDETVEPAIRVLKTLCPEFSYKKHMIDNALLS